MSAAGYPPRGQLPVLQYCTPAQLAVDPAYQRSIETQESQRLIGRIAKRWDWRLCQPLVVSLRADRNLYVVDGQHRLEAARLRGDIPQLPCVVTPYEDASAEAAAFVALNQERRPLGAIQLYRAAVAAGEPDALRIAELLGVAGLRVAPHTNADAWKPGDVSNIAGIRQGYRRHGDGATRIGLQLLAQAFEGQVQRYAGTIYGGILATVADAGAGLDTDLLKSVLQGANQAEWVAEIGKLAAERVVTRHHAAAEAIGAAYREALAEMLDEAA